jgi:BlaI family penicillinase repressor
MKRKPGDGQGGTGLPKPTGREFEIVQILWNLGSGTVREVLDALNADRGEPLAYTTVLRFLQIMREKGLVEREVTATNSHVYRPSVPAERTKRQLAHDLLERVFEGSAHQLVQHALGGRPVSNEELNEIRKLVIKLGEEKS